MQDDLQKAYMAYQQALYFLPNPKVSSICPNFLLSSLGTLKRADVQNSYGMLTTPVSSFFPSRYPIAFLPFLLLAWLRFYRGRSLCIR